MIEIPLSKTGKHAGMYSAKVDDEDSELIEFNWYVMIQKQHTNYAYRTHQGKSQSMHRVIMSRMAGRELKRNEWVDHIDGDGLNNVRSNLRLSTPAQNAYNQRRSRNNTSGYKGVTYFKKLDKWWARIWKNGKQHSLGHFDTPEEAYEAYCRAAEELHGKFANYD